MVVYFAQNLLKIKTVYLYIFVKPSVGCFYVIDEKQPEATILLSCWDSRNNGELIFFAMDKK